MTPSRDAAARDAIIASVEGETLILTASHVVEESGSLYIEVFRYNLALDRLRSLALGPEDSQAMIAAAASQVGKTIARPRYSQGAPRPAAAP